MPVMSAFMIVLSWSPRCHGQAAPRCPVSHGSPTPRGDGSDSDGARTAAEPFLGSGRASGRSVESPTMGTLKVGIVGSRFAAHLHLQAYRRAYGIDVQLAGVTSPTAERRKAFASESGAQPYPDLAAMLPHIDVVDVCSPPATHEPAALEAIDAGKHVFIEKPFTGAFDKSAGMEALL